MKRLAVIFLLLLFVGGSAAVSVLLDLLTYADIPAAAEAEIQVFSVNPGEPFSAVARRLANAHLISTPVKFNRFARLRGFDKRVKAGEYDLSAVMTPRQILTTLVEGKVRLHRLTIPEGYNLMQIAQAAAEAGMASEAAFFAAATDSARARQMGLPADNFEGYLFPDTYLFPRGESPEKMVEAMVQGFNAVFGETWRRRADELGLTVHQVVTLASIVEKETGAAFERPRIASVFHNRLARGMRLESDPTVIYGIASFDGNLTRKHLKTMTPYNTYRIRGLPPGPIASPGRASLEAVLFPEKTDYLYFVSKKDGTHYFSRTFREHKKAVRKYQLGR